MYVPINWVSVASGNGLSPIHCQAITSTYVDPLSNGLYKVNFCEILIIGIQLISFMKIHFEMSARRQPFFSDLIMSIILLAEVLQ